MAQRRRTWQRDPDDKKTRLLDAAATLFRSVGFEGTRTADIAAACDVSEGTLFHYFGSKRTILDAVVARYARGMVDAMLAGADNPGRGDLPEIIERLFQYAREQGTLVAHLDREPGARHAPSAVHRAVVVPALARLLEGWREQGNVRVEDCERTAALLYGLAGAGLSACFVDGDGADQAKWVREVQTCFERILGLQGGE